MSEINDIIPNLNYWYFDYTISFFYFITFIFIIIFLFLKYTIKIKSKKEKISDFLDIKLRKFEINYKKYDINTLYKEINSILFISLNKSKYWPIKILNQYEIEKLNIDNDLKNRLINYYIHQFDSNFDTNDYRENLCDELFIIIKKLN